MAHDNRSPEQGPQPLESDEQRRDAQLDPETRDRKATNDGQVRRPNGVGESDDPKYRDGI